MVAHRTAIRYRPRPASAISLTRSPSIRPCRPPPPPSCRSAGELAVRLPIRLADQPISSPVVSSAIHSESLIDVLGAISAPTFPLAVPSPIRCRAPSSLLPPDPDDHSVLPRPHHRLAFSLIIESFGYDAEQSLLYGCISGAVEVVALLGWAYTAKLTKNRILCGLGGPVLALIGSSILVGLPLSNVAGRLAGYYITQAFIPGLIVIFYLIASNVAG